MFTKFDKAGAGAIGAALGAIIGWYAGWPPELVTTSAAGFAAGLTWLVPNKA
jgi:hypothetical protein